MGMLNSLFINGTPQPPPLQPNGTPQPPPLQPNGTPQPPPQPNLGNGIGQMVGDIVNQVLGQGQNSGLGASTGARMRNINGIPVHAFVLNPNSNYSNQN